MLEFEEVLLGLFLHNFSEKKNFLVAFWLVRPLRLLMTNIKPVSVRLYIWLHIMSLGTTGDLLYVLL